MAIRYANPGLDTAKLPDKSKRLETGRAVIEAVVASKDEPSKEPDVIEEPKVRKRVQTGAEFMAWRKSRDLTVAQASDATGWSVSTILRAEKAPETKLPKYITGMILALGAGLIQ